MEKQWLAVDYQRAIVFDRCHLALRVHFFDLFEFPFDKQSAGFVCVPRCTEQSDKKKIIPYGFQTPYSLCTGLHRFGTLITSLIIVPLHNQFIPVEKI